MGEHRDQTVELGRHPALALTLEIVFAPHFLVKHGDMFLIADKDAVEQQQLFQLPVFSSRAELTDMAGKPLIVNAHARTDEG